MVDSWLNKLELVDKVAIGVYPMWIEWRGNKNRIYRTRHGYVLVSIEDDNITLDFSYEGVTYTTVFKFDDSIPMTKYTIGQMCNEYADKIAANCGEIL